MKEILIEIKNLSYSYDDETVLENINFKVESNDFIGIIGPNGGGKTTLVKIMVGLLKNQNGIINYHQSITKSGIGYMPQVNNLDENYPISVREVILSGISNKNKWHRKYNDDDYQHLEKISKEFGTHTFLDKTIGKLSGGQMQRVMLSRAIISSPRLLILDEPNTFVDTSFEAELYPYLEELNKKMAIVMVNHDIGTIASCVKSIACVNKKLHYHPSNKISQEQLDAYDCPIKIIAHGDIPHTILKKHPH